MVHTGVAEVMRLTELDAEHLLNGYASDSVAEALGVDAASLQSYLDTGTAPATFAGRLGMLPDSAEEIGIRLTKKGRIGLIVGILLED